MYQKMGFHSSSRTYHKNSPTRCCEIKATILATESEKTRTRDNGITERARKEAVKLDWRRPHITIYYCLYLYSSPLAPSNQLVGWTPR